jgi:hypothetical protein
MSLTAALAVLGGVVLLGLVLHGWWRVRRVAPKQTRDRDDVPTVPFEPDRDRVEPSLGLDGEPAPGGPLRLEEGLQPVTPAELAAALRSPPRRELRLDALIDAIVPLVLEHPIAGETALAHLPPTRRAGSKPFYLEGLDVHTGLWEPLALGQRYSELQAGVQLASRSGPLNEIEYSEFVQKVQSFADGVGGFVQFPDMLDVVARARELDQFAASHDAQLALLLRARATAWTPGFVQQAAFRHGFMPGALPGRLVLPSADEGAPPVLTLQFDAQAALADNPEALSLRELTLTLDVPQTPAEQEPFGLWQESARALSRDLEAEVCDDRGQMLGLHAFAAIDVELKKLYEALAQRDLAAGSPAARRLFS